MYNSEILCKFALDFKHQNMTLFFELLQVALGRRDALSRVPTEKDWGSLFVDAHRQAMLGILFCGIEQLPAEQRPTGSLLRRWIAFVQRIEERNAKWDARSLTVLKKLSDLDLRATILKGQGLARLYGEMGKRRHCGDIDVFVDGGAKNALQKTSSLRGKTYDYKHAELQMWDNTEVEMHYRPEFIYSLSRNHRLQKWFATHKEELFHVDGEWVTPSLEMNLFYILLHIYRHFFYQGVGMRQIVDYYFVLKNYNCQQTSAGKDACMTAVKTIGMEPFARGLMWVMGEVLAMPREWMPWEPDEREGHFILAHVMEDGNFGLQYDRHSRLKGNAEKMLRTLRHHLHLLRRYPIEVLSAPWWMIYLRLWKLCPK